MTATEAITRVQRMVADRRSFHSPADILSDLNLAAGEITKRAESIFQMQFRAVQEGRASYGLFPEHLATLGIGFRRKGSRSYIPLTRQAITTQTFINERSNNSTPKHYDIWGKSNRQRVIGAVANVVSNLADQIVVDTGISNLADFVRIGDTARNITDAGAEGIITNIAQSQFTVVRMVGGERNSFEADDQIRFISPASDVDTLVLSPPPDFTDDTGNESIVIFAARQHRIITQDHIDNNNDDLEVDPYLEEAFLHHMAYYTSMAEDTIDSRKTQLFRDTYEDKYTKELPRVKSKMKEFISLWFTGKANTYSFPFIAIEGNVVPAGHVGNQITIR